MEGLGWGKEHVVKSDNNNLKKCSTPFFKVSVTHGFVELEK